MQKNICIPKISSSLEFQAHAYTNVKGLYDLKLDDLFDIPIYLYIEIYFNNQKSGEVYLILEIEG